MLLERRAVWRGMPVPTGAAQQKAFGAFLHQTCVCDQDRPPTLVSKGHPSNLPTIAVTRCFQKIRVTPIKRSLAVFFVRANGFGPFRNEGPLGSAQGTRNVA